jgi:protein PhnA
VAQEELRELPACPSCASTLTYEDNKFFVCPDCGHEWPQLAAAEVQYAAPGVRDANGTALREGDSVSVIKDLKVKGSSTVLKVGTKVKGIRLVESDDGHNIDCRIEGIGAMRLKSEFVKKA